MQKYDIIIEMRSSSDRDHPRHFVHSIELRGHLQMANKHHAETLFKQLKKITDRVELSKLRSEENK